MVTVLTAPYCQSSKRARAWFEKHDINFIERNIYSESLTIDEIKGLVRMTGDGVDEIISKRSKVYKAIKANYETLPIKDLFTIISNNPGILRSPILFDRKRIIVGFSEDQIRCFLPRKVRSFYLQKAQQALNG